MLRWLQDAIEYLYELERYTKGGGVNAILGVGLAVILTSGAAGRMVFAGCDRLSWWIERRREYRLARERQEPWEAKPYPKSDSRIKLGGLWLFYMVGCLGMLAVIRLAG